MTLLFQAHLDRAELRAKARMPVVINTAPNQGRFWRPDCSTRNAAMPVVITRPTPAWKRTMDIVLASASLLLAAPILLTAAAAIRLTSRGPAIFSQKRAGIGGREFVMYKFRTMVVDAEARKSELLEQNEAEWPVFKINHDPRMTRLGWLLRKSSIDELPQLWNVLKGEMSLVGPRPLPCDEANACHDGASQRLAVAPGITCTWQVRGRSNVGFKQWLTMDLDYIARRSMWLDIKILLATIPAVLSCRGAR